MYNKGFLIENEDNDSERIELGIELRKFTSIRLNLCGVGLVHLLTSFPPLGNDGLHCHFAELSV